MTAPLCRPAIFLDRDGTLIEEVNFLSRVEDLRLFPFTAEAVRLFRSAGFRIVVITNQSGVARGLIEEAVVHAIHDRIQDCLENGIDAFYFCPHLPNAGCRCRKPGLALVEAASQALQIDAAASWFIGDKLIDVETGKNAGMRSAMVRTGYGKLEEAAAAGIADVVADDLLAAAREIIALHAALPLEA
jgi:D-glycero-D-manno-heptose 1,7-bisphosphate phosphatase